MGSQDAAGRHLQGSCSGWWAEGWRVGALKLAAAHGCCLFIGQRAGLMGQPGGHGEASLRGAIEGGPSLLPQLLQLSWAPGAWGSVGPSGVPACPLLSH